MAEKFKFAQLKGFQPFEGRDAVPWIGDAEVRFLSASLGASPNDESRKYIKFTCEVTDPDCPGTKLGGQVFYEGEDKNGDALARQLGELLWSRGMSIDNIHAAADSNEEMEIDEIIKAILDPNKRAYARVGADIDPKSGRQTSPINGWVDKETHEKNMKSGRARQPLPPAILAKLGAGAGAGGAVPNLGGAPNGAAGGTTVQAPASAPGSRVVKL